MREIKGFVEKEINGVNVLERTWSKETEVVWYGKCTSTYRVQIMETNRDTFVVSFYKDESLNKCKTYSFGFARMLNAVKNTVDYAGYEW